MELGEGQGQLVDVYRTSEYVVLTKGTYSLWCDRKNGQLIPRDSVDIAALDSPVLLGRVWGCIGKIRFFTDGDWKLLLITQASSIGTFPSHGQEVFCVDQVAIVTLSTDTNPEVISMEALGSEVAEQPAARPSSPTLGKRLRKNLSSGAVADKGKELKDKDKVERRLTEALLLMFNDSHSFYFCPEADLTQSLQRMTTNASHTALPFWQQVDERFFWNKQMLSDLTEGTCASELCDPWVVPVVQGYMEVRQVAVINSELREQQQQSRSRRNTGEQQQQRRNSGADLRSRVLLQCSSDDFGFEMIQMDAVDKADYSGTDDSRVEEVESGSGYESDEESNASRDADDGQMDEPIPEQMTHTIPEKDAGGSSEQLAIGVQDLGLDVLRRRESNLSTDLSSAVEEEASPFRADTSPDGNQVQEHPLAPAVTMAIVSRRSRHRAGTRYRRRGVDIRGDVANYVETEVVVQSGAHLVSYVITRGSVPVYWTQPGYKYRPLPVIEKGVEETKEAFKSHCEQQLLLYNEIGIVNLVQQAGREKALADAYEDHVLLLDNPLLTYIAFDFHQHYKSNKVYGVKKLLDAASELIRRFKFCWVDTEQAGSVLCKQDGVFRVNCMDCLDRTNVIQSVLSREVLQSALQKLGVIPFEEKLEGVTLQAYQELWANNGDFISRQYTGTAAMKGDITRYGERKLAGLMKDGYNSAHRYYLNIFRDTYKQVLIDLMQGASPTQAFASLPSSMRGIEDDSSFLSSSGDPVWSLDREEALADMIQHCKQELFPDRGLHVQGWALVEPEGYSFMENCRIDNECVIMQCREKSHLCVASYRSDLEQVCCFIRIPMEKIEKIVVGPIGMLLRSTKRLHMRIYYSLINDCKCYFTLKTVNFVSMEEDRAILMSIANALSYVQSTIHVQEQKLTKRRSPLHQGVVYLMLPGDWEEVDEPAQEDQHQSSPGTPPLGSTERGKGSDTRGMQADVESELDEDDEEVSLSAPSSPKVDRKVPLSLFDREGSAKRSKSFDDIISSVNNEQPKSHKLNPVIRSTVSPLFRFNDGSDSDADTGDELDKSASQMSMEVTDASVDSAMPQTELQQSETKFSRLKGKFRNLKSGALKRLEASSKTTATDDSDGNNQVRQKFLAVGQRFRSNSPSALRTSRGRSPQREPSDSETKRQEAREKSQSKFIHI